MIFRPSFNIHFCLFRGGTHSNIMLIDGRGDVLAKVEGPSTNHYVSKKYL